MSDPDQQAVPAPAGPTPTARVVRGAAGLVVALYAAVFTALHGLADLSFLQSWIIGAVGVALVMAAAGIVLTGRLAGVFVTPDHRFSVEWLPIVLIWPLGLSLWGCLGLGPGGGTMPPGLATGMVALMLAAALPPLMLARLPPWPRPGRPWQVVADGQYAMASLVAAAILFLTMLSVLRPDLPTGAVPPPGDAPPGLVGFLCDSSKDPLSPHDEEEADNVCPKRGVASPPLLPITTPPAAAPLRPADHGFVAWGGLWLVLAGFGLAGARSLAVRRGGAPAMPAGGSGLAEAVAAARPESAIPESGVPESGMSEPEGPGPGVPMAAGESMAEPEPSPVAIAADVPAAVPAGGDEVSARLQDSVGSLSAALSTQKDANRLLRSSIDTLQGRLEKQTRMISQMAAEALQNAEENRRTVDSLSRLLQGMKGGDL